MSIKKKLWAVAAVFVLTTANATPVMAEESLLKALKSGTPLLDLNYRYESADDDLRPERGEASTIRIRAGYKTADFKGFSVLVELESTNNLGSDDYDAFPGPNPNNDRPDKAQYGVIADPLISELNRAYLQYTGFGKTAIKVGRQRVILPTARFVGNVGWRQNEQTFDAFFAQTEVVKDATITYAYLFERHDIVGVRSDMDTHLFDAAYSGFKFGTVTAYAYLLDLDGFSNDSKTFGIRLEGKGKFYDVTFLYKTEYADQSDYADATPDFSVKYLSGELGSTFFGVTAKVGYELLGSDDGKKQAFSTPLASLHKFNGWADRFLATPAAGLEDIYGEVSGSVMGVNLSAIYHDFSSDVGGTDYGKEIDLQAVTKYDKFTFGLKFASYDADHPEMLGGVNKDVTKFWFWIGYEL
ncbi:MAG: alginate export family protein [Syntrophales bacterium]|nr:alginate export family protein [Syntrophales bacterium]